MRTIRWSLLLLAVTVLSAAQPSGGEPPTVATPAAASPAVVTATTCALSVLGADDGGEKFLKYAWTVDSPSVRIANAGKPDTTATFTAVGSYRFTATITDRSGQRVTSGVTVAVTPTVAGLAITPAATSVRVGGTAVFTAAAVDQFGAATPAAVAWAATGGAIDGSGLFTAATPGTGRVTATAGDRSASATVTIADGPPVLVITSPVSTPSTTIAARQAAFAVRAGGGSGALTCTWSASGPRRVSFRPAAATDTTATFSAAGSYTITATVRDAAGQRVTSSLDVQVVATPTTLAISPTAVVLNPGQARTFRATVRNQFGARIGDAPVTWEATGGTVVGGIFTAGAAPGGGSVTATATGHPSATATAVVRINAPPTVAVAAAYVPCPGGVILSVLGADDGGEGDLRYLWSSNRRGVTFSGAIQNTNAAKVITATAPPAPTPSPPASAIARACT